MRRLATTGAFLAALGLAALLGAPVVALADAAAQERGADAGEDGPASQPGSPPAAEEAPVEAAQGTQEGEPAAGAGDDALVEVIKVDGLLDSILVDFVLGAIDDAERTGAVALVLQVDSNGAVVDDDTLRALLERVRDAETTVAVWAGPAGGATRESALLAAHAEHFGMGPGTAWGLAGRDVADDLLEDTARDVPRGRVSAGEADDRQLTSVEPGILGDLIIELPGVETTTVLIDGEPRRETVNPVRFSSLSLLGQLLHTVASPPVAYLLLTAGLALLIFELFTAGVGVAGVFGAGSLLLAGYGFGELPFTTWALAFILASMVAFAVDVQTGVPRVWSAIGGVLYVVGSLFLYDGVSMSWITLSVAFVGVALTFGTGMPSMVRTRFSTPTIGREWMVGHMGRAVTDVAPDGVVQIDEALWRATTNRATPIEELDAVRVVGIDGLVLEVEPEEGGARDYRERARDRSPGHGDGGLDGAS